MVIASHMHEYGVLHSEIYSCVIFFSFLMFHWIDFSFFFSLNYGDDS